jgi:hypothetical protein
MGQSDPVTRLGTTQASTVSGQAEGRTAHGCSERRLAYRRDDHQVARWHEGVRSRGHRQLLQRNPRVDGRRPPRSGPYGIHAAHTTDSGAGSGWCYVSGARPCPVHRRRCSRRARVPQVRWRSCAAAVAAALGGTGIGNRTRSRFLTTRPPPRRSSQPARVGSVSESGAISTPVH